MLMMYIISAVKEMDLNLSNLRKKLKERSDRLKEINDTLPAILDMEDSKRSEIIKEVSDLSNELDSIISELVKSLRK